MTAARLNALADRVEAATGPDRELDAEIALAGGIVRERDGDCFYGHRDYSVMVLERNYYDHDGNAPELPTYTASLDAAFALIGNEWRLHALGESVYSGGDAWMVALVRRDQSPPYSGPSAIAATPALALTAAALRSRARAMEGE